jgi:hypothetical protein
LSSSNIIIYYLCSDELLKRVVERPQLRKATTVISNGCVAFQSLQIAF